MNSLDAVHNSIIGAGHLIAIAIAAVVVICFAISIGISVFREKGYRDRKLWV